MVSIRYIHDSESVGRSGTSLRRNVAHFTGRLLAEDCPVLRAQLYALVINALVRSIMIAAGLSDLALVEPVLTLASLLAFGGDSLSPFLILETRLLRTRYGLAVTSFATLAIRHYCGVLASLLLYLWRAFGEGLRKWTADP